MNHFDYFYKEYGFDCQVYQDASELGIKQTPRTPFVWFLENGELYIAGRLIPEHSNMFLFFIEKWMEETGAWNQQLLKVKISLEYMTGLASKLLLRLLKLMRDHCRELVVSWHYYNDQPYMLELGQFMAASLDGDFKFVSMVNKQDSLDRDYRKCLIGARELSTLLRSRIEQFNEISHKSYVVGEFEESLLQEIQQEACIGLAREILTLKSKFQELYLHLDQYRLSIMKRDLDEGKELNEDIRQWWGNRY